MDNWRRRALTALLLLAIVGCASSGSDPSPQPAESSPEVSTVTAESIRQREIEQHVDKIMDKATIAELWITPALRFLTERRGGELVGLEHRLKTRQSVTRKLSSEIAESPDTPLVRLRIEDAVRYTIVIEDVPPGHHDESIHEILEIMDGVGHDVSWVKNFWPEADDYSGVNSVLMAPNGTFWELQFHTPESLATKEKTHVYYEEFRLPSTSIERKRELFETMAKYWEEVSIPEGILEPGSLHETEELRQRPPP